MQLCVNRFSKYPPKWTHWTWQQWNTAGGVAFLFCFPIVPPVNKSGTMVEQTIGQHGWPLLCYHCCPIVSRSPTVANVGSMLLTYSRRGNGGQCWKNSSVGVGVYIGYARRWFCWISGDEKKVFDMPQCNTYVLPIDNATELHSGINATRNRQGSVGMRSDNVGMRSHRYSPCQAGITGAELWHWFQTTR